MSAPRGPLQTKHSPFRRYHSRVRFIVRNKGGRQEFELQVLSTAKALANTGTLMGLSTDVVSTPAIADHPIRAALLLGALGVVFGDIGTSPIYAFRESLRAAGNASEEATVLGILSLVFWAIVLVVAIKYVVFVMRADNEGEGGTMALLSLALPIAGPLRTVLLIVGLAGASLFFGDAMITPAISVLSAIEGLGVATPAATPYVVPIAALVLVCLFLVQSRGSAAIGFLFGPVMAVWFATLAIAGAVQLLQYPSVLFALSPKYALAYVARGGAVTTFAVLGSVFLALTGGEALYADMGHFGRSAIRINWFAFVLPALVLVYLGQGALVLADPASADNPFFLLFPNWLLIPAVLLTTAATVIACQAVLSGAFALVQQAIQLGAIPRLEVRQTSEESAGQVYVPQVNWLLAAAVVALVFGFRSSDALANAYGIAVAGDMTVTTVLVTAVACSRWHWPPALVFPVAGMFLLLDLTFVSANVHKIPAGGWFPLLVGIIAHSHVGLAQRSADCLRTARRGRHESGDFHRRSRSTRRTRAHEWHRRVSHEGNRHRARRAGAQCQAQWDRA
jgi:KUP system potassium uptake protein